MHRIIALFFLLFLLTFSTTAQTGRPAQSVPRNILLRIVKAEDERRWDGELRSLMTSANPAVRGRAALAAGRIGNEGALAELANILAQDKDVRVRAWSAFAVGEIESDKGSAALLTALISTTETSEVRARAMEGLGKIAAALPRDQQPRMTVLAAAILEALKAEVESAKPDRNFVLLGITAVLRSRPAGGGQVLATLLSDKDARVRADAGNALARLRSKDGNARLVELIDTDPDPVVRANAARVLGATEEKSAYDKLARSATSDKDARVRISAIRALITLKDERAAPVLLKHGESITDRNLNASSAEVNELLEISTALGRLLAQKSDGAVWDWLRKGQIEFDHSAPEVELALVRISPDRYLTSFGKDSTTAKKQIQQSFLRNWRSGSSIAQALGEIAALPETVSNRTEMRQTAESYLRALLDYKNTSIKPTPQRHTEHGIPDVLRALAAYKPQDLANVLRSALQEDDVVIRGTAADLLGDLPPSEENTAALVTALPRALKDDLNDASMSIIGALAKQKSTAANEAIKTALDSTDILIRRRAATALKTNGFGDFDSRIGSVQTKNTAADYQRALSRIGKNVRAVVTTTKGSFTMALLPEEAPLTVDNFVQLAQRGYYRGMVFHRVVPNFVIQDGDPRGDGNGGPGYSIRCEVNDVAYDRGTVGMALAGKDTGGSQWFVTHSPQPHLDGGYTVFGRVVSGMNVVDSIIRGDVIRSIVIR